MSDEEATAIYNDEDREGACLDYINASIAVGRRIHREVTGRSDDHEAEELMLAALLVAEVVFLNSH